MRPINTGALFDNVILWCISVLYLLATLFRSPSLKLCKRRLGRHLQSVATTFVRKTRATRSRDTSLPDGSAMVVVMAAAEVAKVVVVVARAARGVMAEKASLRLPKTMGRTPIVCFLRTDFYGNDPRPTTNYFSGLLIISACRDCSAAKPQLRQLRHRDLRWSPSITYR